MKFEKRMLIILTILAVTSLMMLITSACTDAQVGRLQALGDPAQVVCYSGGKVIYEGISTGRVASPENSDGYQFKDKETGKLVEVSGECIIRYSWE